MGELVFGKNVIVVFMFWNGYNYEDLILIFECIVKDDVFILVYIEEFEVVVCDIKFGLEEIICDILNVGEEVLCNFDEVGIVYIGVEVGLGDILVGKIILKGESLMILEEKFLCVIFGEKVLDVCDILLCLLLGDYGIVVEVCVFNCYGVEKDECVLQIECEEVECLLCDCDDEFGILDCNIYVCLKDMIFGKEVVKGLKGIKVGIIIIDEVLNELSCGQWWQLVLKDEDDVKIVEVLNEQYEIQKCLFDVCFDDKVEKVCCGDDLLLGVMKMVKVFIVVKCKFQFGDKMVGCYGNKGVILCVVLVEDMLFFGDGIFVDFVLNLLGVFLCMNVGQIFEIYMGWVLCGLGIQIDEVFQEYCCLGDMIFVCDVLKLIYGDDVYVEGFVDMDENDLIDVVSNVICGVLIVMLVFDGVKEVDVNDVLVCVGFLELG